MPRLAVYYINQHLSTSHRWKKLGEEKPCDYVHLHSRFICLNIKNKIKWWRLLRCGSRSQEKCCVYFCSICNKKRLCLGKLYYYIRINWDICLKDKKNYNCALGIKMTWASGLSPKKYLYIVQIPRTIMNNWICIT